MTDKNNDYVDWFRRSSPYINAHRGRTFVILLSGEAVASENFCNIVHDIALLNSLGVKLVLVHGARPQISVRMQQAGLEDQYHNGLRITDEAALSCVSEATGAVRAFIEAQLSMGLPNSPMHLSHIRVCGGNFVVAKPMGVHEGVDYLHTGEVRRIDTQSIESYLESGALALVSAVGYSPTGEMFNLSAESVATELAAGLQADKLIVFSDQPGLYHENGDLLHELKLSEASFLLEKNPDNSLLKCVVEACRGGVQRAQVISYLDDGALIKELFTRDGCGSLIYQDTYESLRTAVIDDVGGVLELIEPLEKNGTLVRRSRELLETEIARFTVMERDGMIIACAALYPFIKEGLAELACVVTHPDYRGDNRGERLLNDLEKQAKTLGIQQLFVLTTQTTHWFMEQGFSTSNVEQLPERRQALYNLQRNSKVLIKNL
ncbi:MAG: amino-acid N-acetyltransferase [Pseudomonadales bacterium]